MKHRRLMSPILLVLALAGTGQADPVYSVTPVNFDTTGVLLNDQGQYVVPAYNGAYLVNGSGLNPGQVVPITIPGATFINPTGLNNMGQVVGTYTGSSGPAVTFLYSDGQTTNLSAVAGFRTNAGTFTEPAYIGNMNSVAMSDSGAVAGTISNAYTNLGNDLGLYNQGSVTNLGLPATGLATQSQPVSVIRGGVSKTSV
jgi:probable HAF family extracellular repeat protein